MASRTTFNQRLHHAIISPDRGVKNRKQHYRSRNDLIADILKIALDGTLKTGLMYGAYMSFNQIDKVYLPLLLKNGMLKYNAEDHKYRTTKKGREFLDAYAQLRL